MCHASRWHTHTDMQAWACTHTYAKMVRIHSYLVAQHICHTKVYKILVRPIRTINLPTLSFAQVLGSDSSRDLFRSTYAESRASKILNGVSKQFLVVESLNCSADETGVVVSYTLECEYSMGTLINRLDSSSGTCESILL